MITRPFSLCSHRDQNGERFWDGECRFCCTRCKGFGVVEITRKDGSLKRDGERTYHECTCNDGRVGVEAPKSDDTLVIAGDHNPAHKHEAYAKTQAGKPIGLDALIDKLASKYRMPRGEADSIVRRSLSRGYLKTWVKANKDEKQLALVRNEEEGDSE